MQGMRDLLRSSIARGLRDLRGDDRVAMAWPVACGSALAAHGELLGLDAEGLLHVRVRDRVWLETFRGMRSALASDLSRISGVRVREIHFEVQGASVDRGGKGSGQVDGRGGKPGGGS